MPRSSSRVATFLMSAVVVVTFVWIFLKRPPAVPVGTGSNDYIGRVAPEFSLTTLDGQGVRLSDARGRVVVLDLWATWCPPCVAELPEVTDVASAYADRGVVFYAVNMMESPDVVRTFLDRHKLRTKVLLDPTGKVGEAFGAQYIPLLVVIGRDGRILAHDNVDPAAARVTLTKWIESALASGQAK